jgi:hypothetical protein
MATLLLYNDGESTWQQFGARVERACTLCYHACMKKQAEDVQYTVRGIPAEVDRELRRKAARRKLSLNQVIVEELTAATIGRPKRGDFSDLVGQWTPDPAFDEIVSSQRQIDPEKWT